MRPDMTGFLKWHASNEKRVTHEWETAGKSTEEISALIDKQWDRTQAALEKYGIEQLPMYDESGNRNQYLYAERQ